MRQLNRYAKWMTIPFIISLHIALSGELRDIFYHPTPWSNIDQNLTRDAVLGLGIGVLYVAISRWWVQQTQWGRSLEDDMLTLLRTRPRAPIENALASAFIEEIVFRGVLLQYVSIWVGAGIFAIFHVPTRRTLILWMLSAFGMGLVFGGVFLAGFSLVAPLTAHFTVNYMNLHYLNRRQNASA